MEKPVGVGRGAFWGKRDIVGRKFKIILKWSNFSLEGILKDNRIREWNKNISGTME